MNAGNIIAHLQLRTDEFRQGLSEAQASMQRTSADFKKIGATMAVVGGAAAYGIGKAVKKAAEFEKGMSQVGAVSGATGKDFDDLRSKALQLGAETSFSAVQASEGMNYLAMSGFNATEIIAAMPGVLNMAAAGGVEVAVAADIASNALSAFGLEASESGRVADVLTKTFTSSNTTVAGLGETMKYAAPAAKAVGWSIESVAAAAGKLGDVGIDASQAGTVLRSSIAGLAAPSDAAASIMDKYGIKISDANGKMKPLSSILGSMKTKFAGMSDVQRAAAAQTIFGTQAMSGMLALMEDPKGLAEYTAGLEKAGGTADKVATDQLDNLDGSLEALGGSFETAQIVIGTMFIPIIRKVTEWLTKLINWFTSLSPSMQKFIGYTLAISAAFLLVVGGLLLFVGFLPVLLGWFASLMTVLSAVGGAIAALFSPITLVVLGIGLFVAALIHLWKTNEQFRAKVITIWNAILAFVRPAIAAIVGFVRTQFAALSAWWNKIMPTFLAAASNAWKMIWAVLKPIINLIVAIIKFAFPLILAIIMQVWDNIKGVISGALGVIKGIIEVFSYALTGQWGKLWDSIKNLAKSAFKLVWNLIQLWFMGKIIKVIVGFVGGFIRLFSGLFSTVIRSVGGFIGRILGRFSGLSQSVFGIFGGIKTFIAGVFSGLVGTVMGSLGSLIGGIKKKVARAKEFLGELNPFKRHSPSLVDNVLAGVDVIKKTYSGIGDMKVDPPKVGNYQAGRVDVASMVGGKSGSGGESSTTDGSTNYNAPLVQVANMTVSDKNDARTISNELYDLQRNADRSRGK